MISQSAYKKLDGHWEMALTYEIFFSLFSLPSTSSHFLILSFQNTAESAFYCSLLAFRLELRVCTHAHTHTHSLLNQNY